MKEYQARVVDERTELAEKLERAVMFICSNSDFLKLSTDEKSLLRRQVEVMSEYLLLLDMRVDHFMQPKKSK